MNPRPQVLNFSSALNGFLQYKLAEGLSPATVFNYERDLKLWLEHLGYYDIGRITSTNQPQFRNTCAVSICRAHRPQRRTKALR
jgi:site-specific recombinase XerC